MKPPAKTARRIALALSIAAVCFSIACGFEGRRAYLLHSAEPEVLMGPVLWFLVLLLVALLLRMGGSVCELIWLERTWSNLPLEQRKIGPLDKVDSFVLIAVSFVPGVSWLWKLGAIDVVARAFNGPRRLGVAAVVLGWIPGLNVYIAPFLWELFAIRIDRLVTSGARAKP